MTRNNREELRNFLDRVDPGVAVCGRLHPELGAPCYEALGHSTLGATPRHRAHRCVVPTAVGGDYRRSEWTYVDDHRWYVHQKRRRQHPAGGDQP